MKAIAQLFTALLVIFEKWARAQEQKRHESTVETIQSNPGAFMSDHFCGVSDKHADDADKASAGSADTK
jgi:hypothetical protein